MISEEQISLINRITAVTLSPPINSGSSKWNIDRWGLSRDGFRYMLNFLIDCWQWKL